MKRVSQRQETTERLETRDIETVTSFPTETSSPTESAARPRAFSLAELGAIVWYTFSPLRKQRAIAGARLRELVFVHGIDDDLALSALAEYARGADKTGEPYGAIGFTAQVARERIARIRETVYLAEKQQRLRDSLDGYDRIARDDLRSKQQSLRPMASAIARVLAELGVEQ